MEEQVTKKHRNCYMVLKVRYIKEMEFLSYCSEGACKKIGTLQRRSARLLRKDDTYVRNSIVLNRFKWTPIILLINFDCLYKGLVFRVSMYSLRRYIY